MEKDTKYKAKSWKEITRYENETFENFDFTDTIFENTIFTNVTFKDCLFSKCKMNHIRLFGCNFYNCDFSDVDMRNFAIGSQGGGYTDCTFNKCDFRAQHFFSPRFVNCEFNQSKFKRTNLNDSSFESCKFIGKLEDVTFNGMYHEAKTGFEPLVNVDFSEAVFGDFVRFDNCDLSTCIPPKGSSFDELLYQIYRNNPSIRSTGNKDRIVFESD